jgi:uncharacterized protein (TIGR03067 family)
MVATACPSREELIRYSLGTLAASRRGALDDHLDRCPECQAAMLTLDDASDTVVGRLREPPEGESVCDEPQLHDALAAAMRCSAGDCPDFCAARMGPSPSVGEAPSRSAMPKMLGEYQILEELGRGGMGRVYKALHTKLDRVVALKVLPRGRVGDQKAIARFEREVKAVGRLAHPNIVQAFDAREIDGTPVLIMEYVDGLDLAEIVRRLGPLPLSDACEAARQTAVALQCADEHGLVHRDIKPSNIMLARSGEVKLLDLGLARFYADRGTGVSPVETEREKGTGTGNGDSPHLPERPFGCCAQMGTVPFSSPDMTGAGQAMGTADYMAPEQASDSRTVDIRADLYSLGCTLYKLLSGRAPFGGPEYRLTHEKISAQVHQTPPALRGLAPAVPEKLAAVVDRLLAKNPDDRFSTPTEVAEALTPWCAGADLPALLERALSSPLPLREGQGEGVASSRLPLGEGQAKGLTAAQRRKLILSHAVAMLLAGAIGFALGIMIRIHRDGKDTDVEVPDGSKVRVTDKVVDVTLPGRMSSPSANANPAADLKALEGQWRVVRVEKGKNASASWSSIRSSILDYAETSDDLMDPAYAERFAFENVSGAGWQMAIKWSERIDGVGAYPMGWAREIHFQIDPTATPKTIELYREVVGPAGGVGTRNPAASGVYEVAGDRMRICLAGHVAALKPDQRPKSFTVDADSADILFVLEHYQPPQDEKTICGTWAVATRIDDGKSVSDKNWPREVATISDDDISIEHLSSNNRTRWQEFMRFRLDVAQQPREITFFCYRTVALVDGKLRPQEAQESRGIYKFDGDRLTLAYRKGKKPPEAFESKPGSGVTLLVLERTAPQQPAAPAAVSPAAELKALRGSWKVVRAEKGKDADESWPIEDLGEITAAKLDRFHFYDDHLDLVSLHDGSLASVVYRIDPTEWPKRIDLSGQSEGTSSAFATPGLLFAVGVYEVQEHKLLMRLTRHLASVKSDQRPKSVQFDSGAGDILFTLERYRLSGDEKAIQGKWFIASITEDARTNDLWPTGERRTIEFSHDFFHASSSFGYCEWMGGVVYGVFVLGDSPANMPKSITLFSPYYGPPVGGGGVVGESSSPEQPRREKFLGIYKFDRGQLTLAFRRGDKPPASFESKPNSGVTVLVLRRDAPPNPLAGMGMGGMGGMSMGGMGGTDTALPPRRPAEPPLQFGPVVERVVNCMNPSKALNGQGLDLVGGRLVDLPKEFSEWSAREREKWSIENRVDLVVDDNSLAPQQLKLAALWDTRWDTATAKDLRSALASPTPGRDFEVPNEIAQVREVGGVLSFDIAHLPATFAFQTRKGDQGILQVIRYTEAPAGMRIRYKLVGQLRR